MNDLMKMSRWNTQKLVTIQKNSHESLEQTCVGSCVCGEYKLAGVGVIVVNEMAQCTNETIESKWNNKMK